MTLEREQGHMVDATTKAQAVHVYAQEANVGVDLKAQTVGNLNVDVAEQSVGNFNVDLAEQSVGNLNVNLAADALAGNLDVDLAEQSVGNLGVDVKAQTVGNFNVDVAEQSVGNFNIDIAEQSVGNVAVNVAATALTAATMPKSAFWQGVADATIKATAGSLYGLVAAFAGAAAGNSVVLKNGTTEILRLVAGAANQTLAFNLPFPVAFSTSLVIDVTVSSGAVYVTVLYD